MKNNLLERALRGESVPRPPIWFMRQAGRYMAEYREVRSKVSFLQLCGDADLACEVTLQPIDRFELDAAIVFSDILPVVEAIGREVVFDTGEGPRVVDPVRTAQDVKTLVRPDVSDALSVVPKTLKLFQAARPDIPILGFAGAPYTLFCYLVQGKGSRNWEHPKQMLWSDPSSAQKVLDLLADVVGDYLQSQVDAGAAAVQMFDTWAGTLSNEDYQRWALPAAARAFARVSGAPKIYFTKDTAPFLHLLDQTGADVFGLDWRINMKAARESLGTKPVQGNMDPVLLFAPPDEIRRRVRQIIEDAGPTGHVFNLGHGVLPSTPIEGVEAMVDEVKRWRWKAT
jgi:uroporphyrinogen decarboxylase